MLKMESSLDALIEVMFFDSFYSDNTMPTMHNKV